jgi:hemolysin III
LRGGWGWSLFGVVWGLAIAGMVLEYLPRRGPRILPVVIYLVMGWLALVALQPLIEALPGVALVWLIAGGLAYSAGIAFYALDHRLRYAHNVWHLFVLAGSACHYFVVLRYVS